MMFFHGGAARNIVDGLRDRLRVAVGPFPGVSGGAGTHVMELVRYGGAGKDAVGP